MDDTKIASLIMRALPGETLREATVLGERTWLVVLGDRRRVVLRLPAPPDAWAGSPHEAEAVALRALARELEPSLPELLAHELGPAGFTLLSYCEGQPLPTVIDKLSEDQRYAIGRALGSLVARVHAYAVEHYGALGVDSRPALNRVVRSDEAASDPTRQAPKGFPSSPGALAASEYSSADERDLPYLHERLAAALAASIGEGSLDALAAERISAWVSGNLASSGQPPTLTHGDLAPERVLVRQRERSWVLSGLIGWGGALAWRPAWDHVLMQGAFAEDNYFSVRAGYGNAYDALTERRYDQLREFALLPYRIVLDLEAGRPDLAAGLVQ